MKRIIYLLMLCVASEIDATKLIEAKNDEISTDISSITTKRAMLGIAVVLSDGSSLAGSPELIQACLPPNATFERFITLAHDAPIMGYDGNLSDEEFFDFLILNFEPSGAGRYVPTVASRTF